MTAKPGLVYGKTQRQTAAGFRRAHGKLVHQTVRGRRTQYSSGRKELVGALGSDFRHLFKDFGRKRKVNKSGSVFATDVKMTHTGMAKRRSKRIAAQKKKNRW